MSYTPMLTNIMERYPSSYSWISLHTMMPMHDTRMTALPVSYTKVRFCDRTKTWGDLYPHCSSVCMSRLFLTNVPVGDTRQ